MIFDDRRHAGQALAEKLLGWRGKNAMVLALPRGGVPVAFEIARALGAPLDLVLARKIGAPGNEEFAVGAIAEGGETVTDAATLEALGVEAAYLEATKSHALAEIARRRTAYLGGRAPAVVRGKAAIVVDDGIATGATMEVALRAVRKQKPARLVMAVPVAAPEAIERLRPLADEVVCLHVPARLRAVGMYYRDFAQLRDKDVTDLLAQAGET